MGVPIDEADDRQIQQGHGRYQHPNHVGVYRQQGPQIYSRHIGEPLQGLFLDAVKHPVPAVKKAARGLLLIGCLLQPAVSGMLVLVLAAPQAALGVYHPIFPDIGVAGSKQLVALYPKADGANDLFQPGGTTHRIIA